MSDAKAPEPTLLFRPDAFFLKPWRGWGVVRDPKGRTVDRYEARGEGRTGSRSASVELAFTFESGRVHAVEWDILSDDEGHFYARDLKTGVEARGSQQGGDFRWTFASPLPDRLGRMFPVTTTATYTLATPTTAFSFAEVRRFGRLLSTFTTFYEQI